MYVYCISSHQWITYTCIYIYIHTLLELPSIFSSVFAAACVVHFQLLFQSLQLMSSEVTFYWMMEYEITNIINYKNLSFKKLKFTI